MIKNRYASVVSTALPDATSTTTATISRSVLATTNHQYSDRLARPEGVPVVIENVVEQVDGLVSPVRGTGWQTSHPGDRHVRQELRVVLKNNGLPVSGELFDRAYAYISENY